jgi:hypothetical protein
MGVLIAMFAERVSSRGREGGEGAFVHGRSGAGAPSDASGAAAAPTDGVDGPLTDRRATMVVVNDHQQREPSMNASTRARGKGSPARWGWPTPRLDSEHLRCVPRTCRPLRGRLSLRQTNRTGRRLPVLIPGRRAPQAGSKPDAWYSCKLLIQSALGWSRVSHGQGGMPPALRCSNTAQAANGLN